MPSPVELIVGPARSGKAGRVVAAYLEAIGRAGPGSATLCRGEAGKALMLVPTALRRRATESRLLAAQESGVLIRPQVLTIHELADRILAAAGRPVRRIGELARRQVIRKCLAGLDAKQAAVLGPVRDTPGLVDALDELFRELKAARVEPDAFGKALAEGLRTPRNRTLAVLYAAYQKALQDMEVYDDAGQFWHAAALVAEDHFGPFADLEVLAIDGFQDFAPAQLDMIESLADRAKRTVITLTWQPDRPMLFAVTGRTRERLRKRFGKRLTETVLDQPSGLPADLERLRMRLFALPDDSPRERTAGSISVVRAAGRTREVEEIARRCADLVRGGAHEPASIAVLARSMGGYAPLVREIFPRYGFPFRVQDERPLADCPIVRAAMSLARLQTEGYSFRALARLVRSNYFSAAAFGTDAETARLAVRLAREANVWEGRETYAEGLRYLRNQALRAADDPVRAATVRSGVHSAGESTRDLTVAARNIDGAAAFLERLFAALALPERATRSALAERLREVIRAAGLWDAAKADPSIEGRARNLKAITALEGVLEEVALLDEDEAGKVNSPQSSRVDKQPVAHNEVSLQTFLTEWTQGLALATVSAEEPPDAPVVLLDARQGRALSFDHVIVMGLAEKEFPRRGRRHPFFDDAERRDLRERGVDLADAGHDAEQEMLLFYLAATRARRTLTLSYPSLDAQGRPALASHYLDELAGLFVADGGCEAIPTAEIATRDLALDRPRSERELLASTMYALWGPGETKRPDEHLAVLDALIASGPACPGVAMQSRAAETALAGLAAEWQREHGEAFGPFDGLLGDSEILDELCRRFPREEILSARRLERFGACPFAFLAGEILHLAPLEEPSRDIEAIDLGLIYHDILERFFSAMRDAGRRITNDTLEEAKRGIEKLTADYFAELRKGGRVRWTALLDVERRNVVRDLRRLLDWHAERLAEWQPTYFEVTFGARPGQKVQPPGLAEPISIDGPHGPVRLRGRIDRLDLAAVGGSGFQVIDYKTGAAPSHQAMQKGTSFQLPIYLWAAEAILSGADKGNLARAFFLPIRKPSESGRLVSIDSKGKPNEKFAAAMTRAEKYIHNFVDAMRCGRFPVWPREGCSDSCDYSAICRYAEWRLRRKWELHPVPGLEIIADASAEQGEEADL